MRRLLLTVVLAVGILVLAAAPASAHAALESAEPFAGAALDEPPTAVRLTFSEAPERSVSTVAVLDEDGSRVDIGGMALEPDNRTVRVDLAPLARGAYTVEWRVVSAVDGHATSGVHAFGIGVLPVQPDAGSFVAPAVSRLEVLARWLLLAGLVLLLGAALALAASFAPAAMPIAAAGWCAAAVGLALLAECQRRLADATWAELAGTPVGRALVGRAVALVLAGAALALGRQWNPRAAAAFAAVAAAAAMAAHVAYGHAAAAEDPRWASIAVQWAHVAAAGIWVGGLAAVVHGIGRGADVRRFAGIALGALGALVVAGVVAGVREVRTWDELTATGYGQALLLKVAAVAVVAVLAGWNRWRNLARVGVDDRPLRVAGGGELAAAAIALVAAAALAAMSPPATARAADRPALAVSGHDAATSLRARLAATSAQAGPNRFVVRVTDYDTGETVDADGVSLRFISLDDPVVASSALALERSDDQWRALGNGLAFEGRWRVEVLVERVGRVTSVPLELSTAPVERPVSVVRAPGEAPVYSVDLDGNEGGSTVQLTPRMDSDGRVVVAVEWLGILFDELQVDHMVLTTTDGDAIRRAPVERMSAGTFVARVELDGAGETTATVTARTSDGQRLRGAVVLDLARDLGARDG